MKPVPLNKNRLCLDFCLEIKRFYIIDFFQLLCTSSRRFWSCWRGRWPFTVQVIDVGIQDFLSLITYTFQLQESLVILWKEKISHGSMVILISDQFYRLFWIIFIYTMNTEICIFKYIIRTYLMYMVIDTTAIDNSCFRECSEV